jgi:3D (Asp-Asp-Asp) domain-containing protein
VLTHRQANVGLPEQEAKEPIMTKRINNLTAAALRLTGIASMVAFVGAAAAAPRVMIVNFAGGTPAVAAISHHEPVTLVTQAPAPIELAPKATAPAELLHDASDAAIPAVAIIGPHYRTIRMEVTAYCPCPKCCGANAQGITASGRDVSYNNSRFVAADTSVLPFHTKLIIPGYHSGATVEVIDRGGAIKGNKLDLYFPTHEEALQWGRKWIDVTVID